MKRKIKPIIIFTLIIIISFFLVLFIRKEENSNDDIKQNENIVKVNSIDELKKEIPKLELTEFNINDLEETNDDYVTYATKRLIVNSDIVFDTYNANSVIQYEDMYILSYETDELCKLAYEKLKDNKDIKSVEIDAVLEKGSTDTIDEEVNYNEQVDTELKKYLDSLTYTKDTIVAVVDTGVDSSLSIFDGRLVKSDFDITNENSTSTEDDYGDGQDVTGHGTQIATIIVENTDEHIKIMPVKVANSRGYSSVLDLYLGIKYAMDNGANLINISMNTVQSSKSQLITDVIDEATSKGILVVVSAGNSSTNTNNISPSNVESAIVVSAASSDGVFMDYSNFGDTVDYSASGKFRGQDGTSYSAAYVTSYLASFISAGIDPDKIDNFVLDNGETGKDKYYGKGFLATKITENYNSGVIPDDNYESKIFERNWKEMDDKELAECLFHSNNEELAYFLQNLSKEDLDYVLSKETFLNSDTTIYDFVYDENGNQVMTDDGSYAIETKEVIKTYEYLLNMELDLSYQASNKDTCKWGSQTGHFFLSVTGNGKTTHLKVSLKNANAAGAKLHSDQNVTVSASPTTNYANNHNVTFTNINLVRPSVSANSSKDNDCYDKTTSEEIDGVTKYQSTHYELYVLTAKYTLPAYYKASSDSSFYETDGSVRLNFKSYNWQNTGSSTLNSSATNKETTDEIKIQAHMHNTGNWNTTDTTSNKKATAVNGKIGIMLSKPQHKVTLTYDSGISSVSGDGTYYYGDSVTVKANVKEGYSFSEWEVTSNNGSNHTSSTFSFTMPNSARGWKATTTVNTATIKYNANGGSLSSSPYYNSLYYKLSSSNIVQYSNTETGTYSDFTRDVNYTATTVDLHNVKTFGLIKTGYHIDPAKAWRINNTSTTISQEDNTSATNITNLIKSGNATVTLYANWKINQSTLTINPNGGTWGGSTSSQSFTQNYNTTKTIANPTITNYTATFDAKGGTAAKTSQTTNKAFSSWTKSATFTAGSLSGTTFTFGSANGGTGTLTAAWSGNFNVTLPTATRTGYKFKGWYTSGGTKVGDAGASVTINSNVTYYAQWEPNVYTITLDNQSANSAGTTAYYEKYNTGNYTTSACTTAISTITKPTKTGYTFGGYYTGTNGSGTQYVDANGNIKSTSTTFTANTTLYAKWTPIYYISFNANGGTGSVPDTITFIGDTDTHNITSIVPTREGYRFKGWSVSTTYSDKRIAYYNNDYYGGSADINGVSATVTQSSWTILDYATNTGGTKPSAGGTLTLYAQWEPNTYTLTIDPNGGRIYNGDSTTTSSFDIKFQYGFGRGLGYSTSKGYYGYDNTFGKPYRSGYIFDGWEITSGGGSVSFIAGDATYRPYVYMTDDFSQYKSRPTSWSYYIFNGDYTGDVTIKAKWIPIYYISFNANGGTGSVPDTITFIGDTDSHDITSTVPTREGYVFKGWSANTTYSDKRIAYSSSYGGSADSNNITAKTTVSTWTISDYVTYTGGTKPSAGGTLTLYAQWEKVGTVNIYSQGKTGSFKIAFHNNETSLSIGKFGTSDILNASNLSDQTATSISEFTGDRTFKNYTWTSRGLAKNNDDSSATTEVSRNETSITIYASDISANGGTVNYYASYTRTPVMTLNSYGNNAGVTIYINGINSFNNSYAYAQHNGAVQYEPTFTFPEPSTMRLKEKNAANEEINDIWTAIGWTTETAQDASASKNAGDTLTTYENTIYYGLYQKDVTLTYDANGGTGLGTTKNNTTNETINTSMSNKQFSYTRYTNAADVTKATTNTFTLAIPKYLENGEDKYVWCGWLYKQLAVYEETDTFGNYLVGTSNNAGSFTYTPLVSDTVYAYWIIIPDDNIHAPKAAITKMAEWATPSSDNSVVDFDNLQNIDTNGIAKVTVKVKITNENDAGARGISITDYFDTTKWEYYQDSSHNANMSTGSYTRSNNKLVWNIPDSYTSGEEMTFTYYVKLKESLWTIDADGNEVTDNTAYYINAIEDLTSYKNELDEDGNLKPTSTYQTKDKKALVNLNYTINGSLFSGIPVNKYNATPYVVMRPVNWIPKTYGLEIGTGKNVYRDLTKGVYDKTYFVQYDTKSSDSSNSTFDITSNSSIRRSYSFYQITDNLLDIYSDSKNQVIDNKIGLNIARSYIASDATESNKKNGYNAGEFLKVKSAVNIHMPVDAEGTNVTYENAALTSVSSLYATNQDNMKLSIYPYVRTTNSILNKTFETARITDYLQNQRLDITIDASDPIITPDERIKTESDKYGDWTESDGYVDINLVDNYENPTAQSKTLTFKFKDVVSGISAPSASASDWINYSNENVQVKLERVDNEPIVIFDSALIKDNDSDVVKVNYTSTSGLNKTGEVQVILDHTNDDILGHLKLTIKVIDNVSNWTEKTYDLYVFCITGEISVADIATYENGEVVVKENTSTEFKNGQKGEIKINANGYIDRVTVNFETYLNNKYKLEAENRTHFTSDKVVATLDGDYPKMDYESLGNNNLVTTTDTDGVPILPYEWQVCRWGYTESTLGGIKLKNLKLDEQIYDNTILQKHLSDMIERYQGIEQGESYEVESGSDYVIFGSTLYTYPEMDGNIVISYTDKYELSGYKIYNNIIYPNYVILNDTVGITINYKEDAGNMVGSVEKNTIVGHSEWVQVGEEQLRPFIHYFYMPLGAKEDIYYVTLTAYKDSEKDFKHSISIKLPFTNKESIFDEIVTVIKDN